MMALQQRIAAYRKSAGGLLAELRELDRLQDRVMKAERLGAGADKPQQPPSQRPTSCVDPGPVGFEFSGDVLMRSSTRARRSQCGAGVRRDRPHH